MKTPPATILIGLALFVPAFADGQDACSQLGVDCHITRSTHQEPSSPSQSPSSSPSPAPGLYPGEIAAKNRDLKATALAEEAYSWQRKDTPPNHDGCKKAINLYRKAFKLEEDYDTWENNLAVCADAIGADPDASQEDRSKYEQIAWAAFQDYLNYTQGRYNAESRYVSPERNQYASTLNQIKWSMWKFQWRHGHRCPEPPAFNGIQGCVGNPDMPHNAYPYVPLPIIDGKNWTPRNLMMSNGGHFTITTTDGHVWHDGDNLSNIPIMNSRIQTDEKTTIRLTLPDGHDFVLSPGSDLTMDSFIYDPNENTTKMVMGNIKGVFRFVTAALQKAFPQAMKLQLGPIGQLGMRGTDVEVFLAGDPDKHNALIVDVMDGSASFTDKSGKTHDIPKGYSLMVMDGATIGEATQAAKRASRASTDYTDHWDMTPLPGRELQ